MDRDIVDTLRDVDRRIKILEWWDILGLDSDKPAMDVKRMRLVEDDGVHLTSRANRCAAVSLCTRVRENESESEDLKSDVGSYIKKPRLR